MGSEIIVMKLARLPLSAFMGILPKGSPGRTFARCADCYWLIDVDRFFFHFPLLFFPAFYAAYPRRSHAWKDRARYCEIRGEGGRE